VQHPIPSLQYVLEDTSAGRVIVHPDYETSLKPLEELCGIRLISLNTVMRGTPGILPEISANRRAMILYTSGTTNKPKGVVTTHANIESQIRALVTAWEWEEKDHILNILPLHHVHGIINVLSCALWSGACCEFLPKFDASDVWSAILARKLTLFMAVPTIYYKLIEYWESASQKEKTAMAVAAKTLRLMVSGSAALPVPVMDKWKTITGQTLLERYGMTEIGMALSNPYRGKRQAGHVGLPLPNVEVRLADSENNTVAPGEQGEIQVKGPSVFMEYWRNEKATADAFTVGGWFKTGDIAVFDNGAYKILGRDSVDIIKSGGYKISALEIEDVLRKYPGIADCAVVGLADEAWGEIVAAFIVTGDSELDEKALINWLKERLPAYKIPRKYVPVVELPRNVLGKVTKNELKKRS
jgi:malonyl-CoA/methylmalonyl-CoA synthetase